MNYNVYTKLQSAGQTQIAWIPAVFNWVPIVGVFGYYALVKEKKYEKIKDERLWFWFQAEGAAVSLLGDLKRKQVFEYAELFDNCDVTQS